MSKRRDLIDRDICRCMGDGCAFKGGCARHVQLEIDQTVPDRLVPCASFLGGEDHCAFYLRAVGEGEAP